MSRARPFMVVVCFAAALIAGCASHNRVHLPAADPRPDSLETYIGKLRHVSSAARATPREALTLEAYDPELREGLKELGASASPGTHRRVADAYRRAGVTSQAYSHYAAALALDRRDAASYDGLARVWRDWGVPALGLADAFRAVYYAPGSAEARNTLGTLLHALGRRPEAVRAFERATALNPSAAYAWTNRCYLSFQASDLDAAFAQCRRAVALDPGLWPARNNLALIYAAAGDMASAASQFAAGGDAARQFNMGIVMSARRDYIHAATAFDAARALRPGWTMAADRATQARRLGRTLPERAE